MRIEFTDELGAGQYIEMRDPKKLSWGAQKEIVSALSADSSSGQMDVAEKLFLALARDGYVLDTDDAPVKFPISPDAVSSIPSLVVEKVANEYVKYRESVTPKN